MKRVLVTGVTGQDGPYLAEVPLEKVYEDHGIKRRASLFNTQRVDHIYEDPHTDNSRFKLHYGDLTDSSNLTRILREVEPDEVYNLGAQSHVAVSFEAPEYAADVDAIGTLRLLEAIRFLGLEVGDVIMRIDPRYSRPARVETLLGDPTNAKEESGWVSEITAQEMCAEIVFADLEAAKRLKLLKAHRLDVPVSVEG